eukprot:Seg7984.2 transcript_id=Seg7984.2/GoldUCD/mRNA.D3Y31 product="hypothetical protein" protein_id=Seg7984.2/GoldUCD/D3Y31
MDWESCIICGNSYDLRCPAESLQGNGLELYTAFLQNVKRFDKIGQLPASIPFDEDVTARELLDYKAKWHKSCHLKFATSKLENAKRKRTDSNKERKSKRKLVEAPNQETCIFCSLSSATLHNCSTKPFDCNLRKMATDLEDTAFLARISGGDLIAIEGKYYFNCLNKYRNRHRSSVRANLQDDSSGEIKSLEARAFAELVSFLESSVEKGIYMFTLSEIHTLFEKRLGELGSHKSINKTRLKERILEIFSGQCQEQTDVQPVMQMR